MSTLRHALGNNSVSIDAQEAEEKIRKKEPLLLHKDEMVELAFQSALDPRDKSYLTSHRVLLKDGKGFGSKRKHYTSIPFSSIDAFSVETAGSLLDGDCELRLWSGGHWKTKLEFGKDSVDIFAIQQFMNGKVLPRHNLEYPLVGSPDQLAVASPEDLIEMAAEARAS
ncbi:MAG: hypothetical protein SGARI_005441, partial [Bacillariaceae sp.]